MTGFSVDWLDLREAADGRARDPELLLRTWQWLTNSPCHADATRVVVDLGAGTGSTLRALASRADGSPVPLAWRLVDLDENLLTEARRRHGASHRLQTCVMNLAATAELPLQDSCLVTASALFDLVSAAFTRDLASVLARNSRRQPTGIYAALNYDGITRWTPAHPLDEAVLEAFNNDQRRDKGMGPALGPEASHCLEEIFTDAGFVVHSADSPWLLDGSDHRLVSALIQGISTAVASDPSLDGDGLKDWTDYRLEKVQSGTCRVGHSDVLALPPTD